MRKIFSFLIAFVLAICSLQIAFASPPIAAKTKVQNKQFSIKETAAAAVIPSRDFNQTIKRSMYAAECSPPNLRMPVVNRMTFARKGFSFYPPEQIQRE